MTQLPEELTLLPPRAADAHKGQFGRVLCVGGSRGMTGAISLTGMAALRSGAGLVHVAVPDRCLETVAGFEPSYMTIPLADDATGRIHADAWPTLDSWRQKMDAVAWGPGLGRSAHLDQIAEQAYRSWPCAGVFDADGLNALAEAGLHDPGGPRVLTPHPGEFRRLVSQGRPDVSTACELASQHNVTVVLKGHQTIVTDGSRVYRNRSGNPGMATGGSGDVLTGMIVALLGQRLSAYDAACLGVYLHGRAGDLAASELGQVAMIARDLIEYLPAAFREIS